MPHDTLRCIAAPMFLLVAVVSAAMTMGWLVRPSEDELVHDLIMELEWLTVIGQELKADARLREALLEKGETLPLIWLPLVRKESNGFIQLDLMVRVLRGNPNEESPYLEIANLVKQSGSAFNPASRQRFFSSLADIEGIRLDLLEKYGLVPL